MLEEFEGGVCTEVKEMWPNLKLDRMLKLSWKDLKTDGDVLSCVQWS